MAVLGDSTVTTNQGDPVTSDVSFPDDVSAINGNFSGDVSAVNGSFSGDVGGVNGSFSGNVSGVNGSFSGNVSGVNGSYSGNVSGVDGSFSGDVSGVDGTFSGDLDAGSIVEDDWTYVTTFYNSWTNYSATETPGSGYAHAKYRVLRNGLFIMTGLIKGGTTNNYFMILPSELRPAHWKRCCTWGYNGTFPIEFRTNGEVHVKHPHISTYVYLDGCIFFPGT